MAADTEFAAISLPQLRGTCHNAPPAHTTLLATPVWILSGVKLLLILSYLHFFHKFSN